MNPRACHRHLKTPWANELPVQNLTGLPPPPQSSSPSDVSRHLPPYLKWWVIYILPGWTCARASLGKELRYISQLGTLSGGGPSRDGEPLLYVVWCHTSPLSLCNTPIPGCYTIFRGQERPLRGTPPSSMSYYGAAWLQRRWSPLLYLPWNHSRYRENLPPPLSNNSPLPTLTPK